MIYKSKAITRTIRAEVSLTLPIDSRYYKFTISLERDLPASGVNTKRELDYLWEDSKEQINNQVKSLCKTLDFDYKKLV